MVQNESIEFSDGKAGLDNELFKEAENLYKMVSKSLENLALPHLVALLKRHRDGQNSRAVNVVIRRAANAIKNLAHENSSIKTRVRVKGGTPPLVELLEFTDAKEYDGMGWAYYLTEEADKRSRKVVKVTEQLDLAQAANAEMEAELRRLKVQSDQWRKAAEAAAAMLSGGANGKFVERTGSLDT
ncbi:interactor of constitutive active ROPs 2, chloroplastic-like protein, partial [Tanacetum coccineum]